MATQGSNLFFGGIPTEPDVKTLRDAYQDEDLPVGLAIPFVDVAKHIKCSPDSYRFRTVTSRWRHDVEKDTGKVIGAPGDKTFLVLSASETLGLSKRKLHSSARAITRVLTLGSRITVSQLTEDEKKEHDHTQRIGGAIRSSFQTASRLALPTIADGVKAGSE